jgi:hypothetical protein
LHAHRKDAAKRFKTEESTGAFIGKPEIAGLLLLAALFLQEFGHCQRLFGGGLLLWLRGKPRR